MTSKFALSTAEAAYVTQAREGGLTWADLADEYRVSVTTITRAYRARLAADQAEADAQAAADADAAGQAAAAARAALEAAAPAVQAEARRVFNLTIPLLDALEYGYITAASWSENGIYSLRELADTLARVARYAAEGYTLTPGAAFMLAWDEAHLERCFDPQCPYSCHAEGDAAALADPGTTPVTRDLAARRTAARLAEAEREAAAAARAARWQAPAADLAAAEAEGAAEAERHIAARERRAQAARLAHEVHSRHQAAALLEVTRRAEGARVRGADAERARLARLAACGCGGADHDECAAANSYSVHLGTTSPARLDGCTCDAPAGSHRAGCAWAALSPTSTTTR
jgi:hypothetical protein